VARSVLDRHNWGVVAGLILLETMMNKREIDAIHKVSESLEVKVSEILKDVIEQYNESVAMNVLINVGTSMIAKALVMTEPSNRDNVENIAFRITQMKVEEGHAAVESMMAIGKAMLPQGGAYTCQQTPPKKH
jgi:hypothetical protein